MTDEIGEQSSGSELFVHPMTDLVEVGVISIVLEALYILWRSLHGNMGAYQRLDAWADQRKRTSAELLCYVTENPFVKIKNERPISHQQDISVIIGALPELDHQLLQLLAELLSTGKFF